MLNPNLTGFCYVSFVYRALQRFKQLMNKDERVQPDRTPLALYWSPVGQCVKLVTSVDIEKFMRQLAASVHNLDPVADAAALQQWSSHSLRVGGCVTLHAMGFSALDIQWVLRWRSTAFMVYLRNVAVLATRHFQALDRAKQVCLSFKILGHPFATNISSITSLQ